VGWEGTDSSSSSLARFRHVRCSLFAVHTRAGWLACWRVAGPSKPSPSAAVELGIPSAVCGVQHSARLRMRDDASVAANQRRDRASGVRGVVQARGAHWGGTRGLADWRTRGSSLTNTAQGDMQGVCIPDLSSSQRLCCYFAAAAAAVLLIPRPWHVLGRFGRRPGRPGLPELP
jgi:hypothetical protein